MEYNKSFIGVNFCWKNLFAQRDSIRKVIDKNRKIYFLKKFRFSWNLVTRTSDWAMYSGWKICYWAVCRKINDKFRTRKFKTKIVLALRARHNFFALNLLVQFIVYCTPNCPITSTYCVWNTNLSRQWIDLTTKGHYYFPLLHLSKKECKIFRQIKFVLLALIIIYHSLKEKGDVERRV